MIRKRERLQAFRTSLLCLIAIAVGVVGWEGVARATGTPEAWNSSLYFLRAFPLMILVSFLLGFWSPQRAWRWGLLVILPQPFLMLARKMGAFWIVGLFFFAVLALPCMGASSLGGVTRSYRDRRASARPAGDHQSPAREDGFRKIQRMVWGIALVGIAIPVLSTLLGGYMDGAQRSTLGPSMLLSMGSIFHIVISSIPFVVLAIFSSKRLHGAQASEKDFKREWTGAWAAALLIAALAVVQELLRLGLAGFNQSASSAGLISLLPLVSLLVLPLGYIGGRLLSGSL